MNPVTLDKERETLIYFYTKIVVNDGHLQTMFFRAL